MNAVNPYLKQYKKNQIETATPEQVLILLYDGAIQYLNKAKLAIEQNDAEACRINLVGCERIILEFMNTLDMEKGENLAKNLYRLYEYMYNTLITANISKNIDKVDEVLRFLISLRETWQKAIVIANSEKKVSLVDADESEEDEEEAGDKYDAI